MRTAAFLALAVHGKLNNVVGLGRHSPAKLIERYGDDCEPNLTGVGAARICAKTETCVDITGKQDIGSKMPLISIEYGCERVDCIVFLAIIPVLLVGIAAWHRSLLSAIPTVVGVYATFLIGLFRLPLGTVTLVWIAFAVTVIPILILRFPGQYNIARSLTVIPLWPVLAIVAVLAEREERPSMHRDEIPRKFEAKVNFIDSAGTEGDYLMVFFEEFGDTVFYGDAILESVHGLEEDVSFRVNVPRRSVDELGENILWIKNLVRLAADS